MVNFIKNIFRKSMNPRILFSIIFIGVLFTILILKLFYIQLIKGDEYSKDHRKRLEKNIVINGQRGNIYDKKGKLLAFNTLSKDISIDTSLITGYKTNEEYNNKLNDIIIKLVNTLNNNKENIVQTIPIELSKDGKFEFSIYDKSVILNFIKEIFSRKSIDELTTDERNITASEIVELLAFGKGKESLTDNFNSYKLSQDLDKNSLLGILNIRMSIYLNRYQKYKTVLIANNISEQTIIDINENKESLQGVSINDNLIRKYNDSIYISNIIGYTGLSNNTDEENLIEGKMGLEKTLNNTLKSKNGLKKLYVDSVGSVIDEVELNEPIAGDDIHLSIDLDLQKFIYDTVEDHLTKYYLSHMVESNQFIKDVRELNGDYFISSAEIYNSLLINGVINLNHIKLDSASDPEKRIYKSISNYIGNLHDKIYDIFDDNSPINKFDDDSFNYAKYFFKLIQTNKIILENKLDNNDAIINKWLNYEISPKEYLNYLIKEGIIDISKISKENSYASLKETKKILIDYFLNEIKDDNEFIKFISKNLIKTREIEPRDIIETLYEQGFLEKDENYINLQNGYDTYQLLVNLIEKKILTPGTIAIDPFSASIVVNEPNTGKVLAMVSYPSYDSNRMSDNTYLSYIFNNKSSQLINRPTQLLKAPGSTFKPITAFASLNENVTTPEEGILCTGAFDLITPEVKCWIYPNSHGVLNVSGGIANSCNVYFNTMGYRLGSQKTGRYNSEVGIDYLREYAKKFGLDKKSGVELEEIEPHISDDNAVTSAIGQGSHLYNMANLTKYMSAIANDGSLYDLSVINKIVHKGKKSETEFINNKLVGKVDLPSYEFAAVQSGLRAVTSMPYNINAFSKVGVSVAGKTGTAEEDLSRNNHSSFVGYAPYEGSPEIVVGVLIPNIGTNNEHINISGEIFKYYFEHKNLEE